MREYCLKVLILLAALCLFLGATRYLNNTGDGIPIYPQVVAAVPAAPYTCDATQVGKTIYVDDNNDTAESYLCFCGVDADDSTPIWLKAQDPAVNCF